MFVNRITEQFGFTLELDALAKLAPKTSPPIVPMASLQDIYKAAAEQAKRDHELDKLFNADFYGDHGSGI